MESCFSTTMKQIANNVYDMLMRSLPVLIDRIKLDAQDTKGANAVRYARICLRKLKKAEKQEKKQ